MVEFLLDNPWILLVVGVFGFILWVDHIFKDKTRDKIGEALEDFTKRENEYGLMVYYPSNLNGKSGEVRAAAEDYTYSVQSFFTHKTWPLWLTVLILIVIGAIVFVLLN